MPGTFNPSSNYTGSETAANLNSGNALAVTVRAKWTAFTKDFNYTGGQQTLSMPATGYYKLEVWGAQGGYGKFAGYSKYGGYGGYSVGVTSLAKNSSIYINVGGMGRTYNVTSATSGETTESNGNAYNGGGPGSWRYGDGGGDSGGDGGGATHIAKVSGVLKNLSSHATNGNILIVAGGGGGGMQYGSSGNYVNWTGYGGHGGGINGNAPNNVNTVAYCIPTGATQSSPGSYNIGKTTSGGNETSGCGSIGSAVGGFGYGGGLSGSNTSGYWAGGGGGYYGSYGSIHSAAGGGSGYIGSSNLISGGGITKHMTCYSCTTSTAAATRTNSNTNAATSTATADRAKLGNGYARITYLGTTI